MLLRVLDPKSFVGQIKTTPSRRPGELGKLVQVMEAPGIDPGTSRMLSERSTI